MDIRSRSDILKAYTYFSPASVDVIARIEHMEQIRDLNMFCQQLSEDGLLERNITSHGIVEFSLTNRGRDIVEQCAIVVPVTKYTIFHQLRTKELKNYENRKCVLDLIQSSVFCLSLLQIRLKMSPNNKMEIAELSSVLFGLLDMDHIYVCGPLYGSIPNKIKLV
jgi:hypothetical protein